MNDQNFSYTPHKDPERERLRAECMWRVGDETQIQIRIAREVLSLTESEVHALAAFLSRPETHLLLLSTALNNQ